jgi:hypothetical protein
MNFDKWVNGVPFFTAYPNDPAISPVTFDVPILGNMTFLDIPLQSIIRTYPFTDAYTGTTGDPWNVEKWDITSG